MHYNTSQPLNNIQILRAVAAIGVLLFHIVGVAVLYGFQPHLLSALEGKGVAGVDLFFVISGFIIVYTQHYNPKTPLVFLRDRIIRIVPSYWVLTAVFAMLLFFIPQAFNRMEFSTYTTFSSFTFLTGLLEARHPLIYVGWSIEYEMLFYIIFALTIALGNLTRTVFITAIILMMLVFIFKANQLFLEFAMGMLLSIIVLHTPKLPKIGITFLMIGMTLVVYNSIVCDYFSFPSYLMYGIPFTMILFGVLHIPQAKNNFFVLLGDASYSIYLIQAFTITTFYKFVQLIPLNLSGDLLIILCTIYSILSGLLFFYCFEQPCRKFIKRRKLLRESIKLLPV